MISVDLGAQNMFQYTETMDDGHGWNDCRLYNNSWYDSRWYNINIKNISIPVVGFP